MHCGTVPGLLGLVLAAAKSQASSSEMQRAEHAGSVLKEFTHASDLTSPGPDTTHQDPAPPSIIRPPSAPASHTLPLAKRLECMAGVMNEVSDLASANRCLQLSLVLFQVKYTSVMLKEHIDITCSHFG